MEALRISLSEVVRRGLLTSWINSFNPDEPCRTQGNWLTKNKGENDSPFTWYNRFVAAGYNPNQFFVKSNIDGARYSINGGTRGTDVPVCVHH